MPDPATWSAIQSVVVVCALLWFCRPRPIVIHLTYGPAKPGVKP